MTELLFRQRCRDYFHIALCAPEHPAAGAQDSNRIMTARVTLLSLLSDAPRETGSSGRNCVASRQQNSWSSTGNAYV